VDPSTIELLHVASLTQAVNEVRSPNSFIKNLLFGNHDPKETEDIELSVVTNGGRKMAPFVKKNGQSMSIEGYSEEFQTVKAPNIKINRPLNSDVILRRAAGEGIFADAGRSQRRVELEIARNTQALADHITNAEEYLCALAIRGAISWSTAEGDHFSITFPRLGSHTIDLGATAEWDETTSNPEEDFHTVKSLFSEQGLVPTDVAMSPTAASAFRKNAAVRRAWKEGIVTVGDLSYAEQFRPDGAIYMGRFAGVNCWEYGRSVILPDGTSAALIRDKYVEFFANVPEAEFVLYYGLINDLEAVRNGLAVGERFSKSWEEKDPSALMQLVQSRPLPCLRRPNATLSMLVLP
jgi:hypothetical protein